MIQTYYYPNRPTLIPPDPQNPTNPKPDYLNSLELTGKYIAEQKWNGDNCLIYTGLETQFWNRTGSRLKYIPNEGIRKACSGFPNDCVINAELVHNKTKTIKHTLIVHSILVWKTEPLIGKSWGYARDILESLSVWGNGLKLSELYHGGFWDKFNAADGTIIEGIVLKDPSGIITISTYPVPDVSWMLKVRKPSKKYSF